MEGWGREPWEWEGPSQGLDHLGGWLMLIQGRLGAAGYMVIGASAGVGCAVLGSLAHDALAGPRERL